MDDDVYTQELERCRAVLAGEGIEVTTEDTDANRIRLMDELTARQWEYRYESGGRGIILQAHKEWWPSTTHTIPGEAGGTIVEAFILVLADAIQFDRTMGNLRVGTQFHVPWN